jgi:hypothetical protein
MAPSGEAREKAVKQWAKKPKNKQDGGKGKGKGKQRE